MEGPAFFTDFEYKALDCIAVDLGRDEAAFRAQLSASKVTDRTNTVVGFYTEVRVDKALAGPAHVSTKGAWFDVEGVENGVAVVLWSEDGYLKTVEGFTVGDHGLGGQALGALRFIRRQEN